MFLCMVGSTVRADSNVFLSFVLVLSHGRVALVILHAAIDAVPLFFVHCGSNPLMNHLRNSWFSSWSCDEVLI